VSSLRTTAAQLAFALLIGGCASPPQGTVVLLPDAAGKPTAIAVQQGDRQVLLDQPYAGARLTGSGPQPYASSAQEVQARFAAALAARPAAPATFTLYFVENKDQFTDASKLALDGVLAEIAARPVPDVLVIGHTDKVGSDAVNDALSRQRAEVVFFLKRGCGFGGFGGLI
jgi:outer membrane protein OmpA-like peptidoglycan-associated protein